MKKETLIKTFGVTIIIISAGYFAAYAQNDYKECHPDNREFVNDIHYHNGKECQYEGLECPELLQAQSDAELKQNVINGTDTVWFHNGEVLYPDYVHPDTMVVINAKYLNEELILNKHGLVDGSDDSLWELISEAAVNIEDYEDYIREVAKVN